MSFIANFLKGIIIGIGAVAPGVSGGSLAVIFGIYERITDVISNVFKNFKRNFIFFLPIALGGAVGVLGFSHIMEYFFTHYNVQVKYLFIGLITGTFVSVFREANKYGFKRIYLLPFILSFALTLFAVALEKRSVSGALRIEPGFFANMGFGAVLGFGTIIPGISASVILIYFGAYDTILNAIKTVNLPILIPAGIGFAASIVLFARLINLLFKRFYGYTYYTVLGFVVGSVIPIFPGFAFQPEYFLCVLLLFAGFLATYFLCGVRKPD